MQCINLMASLTLNMRLPFPTFKLLLMSQESEGCWLITVSKNIFKVVTITYVASTDTVAKMGGRAQPHHISYLL